MFFEIFRNKAEPAVSLPIINLHDAMKLPLLAVLTLLPGLLLAQSPPPPNSAPPDQGQQEGQPDLAKRFEYLTAKFNLTSDQQDQLKAILRVEAAKIKAIYQDTSLTPDQKHQEMGALDQDSFQQIKALLTPEQLAQIQQRQPSPKPAEQQPDQNKELEYMTYRLKLTPTQRDQIKTILADQSSKTDAIYHDASLSEDQKHQQIDALHQDTYKQVEAVLTPEQLALFQEMHPQGSGPQDGPFDIDKEVAQITAELKLSASRHDEVKAILTTLYDKTKAVHADTTLNDLQKSDQIQALYEEANKQIREVLTPEQVAAFYHMKRDYYGYYR